MKAVIDFNVDALHGGMDYDGRPASLSVANQVAFGRQGERASNLNSCSR